MGAQVGFDGGLVGGGREGEEEAVGAAVVEEEAGGDAGGAEEGDEDYLVDWEGHFLGGLGWGGRGVGGWVVVGWWLWADTYVGGLEVGFFLERL